MLSDLPKYGNGNCVLSLEDGTCCLSPYEVEVKVSHTPESLAERVRGGTAYTDSPNGGSSEDLPSFSVRHGQSTHPSPDSCGPQVGVWSCL